MPRNLDDLEFMRNAKNWPRWPLLPIKNTRKKQTDGWPLLGFLHDGNPLAANDPSPDPVVYFGDIFTGEIEDKREYESLEAIVADGWIVD